MKKTFLVCAVIGLFMVIACKKSNTVVSGTAGGTWTFKSITYQADSCDSALVELLAVAPFGGTPDSGGELAVDFYNNLPVSPATLKVIPGLIYPANITQAGVGITDLHGTNYVSTGYGNQTVSVTFNKGLISVSGSGIELVNRTDPTDSAPVTFTIHRTD